MASPGSRAAHQSREALLARAVEELGELRYSIILTARWEADKNEAPDRRAELRRDLAQLHRRYSQKIDAIAMSFGVDAAMQAKRNVERTVTVPVEEAPVQGSAENCGAGESVSDSGL